MPCFFYLRLRQLQREGHRGEGRREGERERGREGERERGREEAVPRADRVRGRDGLQCDHNQNPSQVKTHAEGHRHKETRAPGTGGGWRRR